MGFLSFILILLILFNNARIGENLKINFNFFFEARMCIFKIYLNLFILFNEARICWFFKFILILFILYNEARICEFFKFILILFILLIEAMMYGL